jgi:hypothetical protein
MKNKYRKRCFTCKKLKFLIFYKKNHRKYQLASDKGTMVECRLCECKRLIKQNGEILKFNFITNKYDNVNLKVNLFNIIKTYFI